MNRSFLISLYIVLVGVLLLFGSANTTYADCSTNIIHPCTITDLFHLAPVVISAMLAIAVVVFFFMLVMSGYRYITAGGDERKVGEAKSSLIYNSIGFVLVFLPFIAIQVILNVTQANSGISVDQSSGNVSLNPNSTFTATPLPSQFINTLTPTPYQGGSGGGGSLDNIIYMKNRIGCNIPTLDNGAPVFYQVEHTDQSWPTPVFTGGPTQDCTNFGEYDGSNFGNGKGDIEAQHWEGADCSAGALTIVVDTLLNRTKGFGAGNLIISDGINALVKEGALTTGGWSAPPNEQSGPAGIYESFVNAANDMAAAKGIPVTFSGTLLTSINQIEQYTSEGYPVILSLKDPIHSHPPSGHFAPILSIQNSRGGTAVYFDDQGRIIAGGGEPGGSGTQEIGTYTTTGLQTYSIQQLNDVWIFSGTALVLQVKSI